MCFGCLWTDEACAHSQPLLLLLLVHFGHRRELDLPTWACSPLSYSNTMHCSLFGATLVHCVVMDCSLCCLKCSAVQLTFWWLWWKGIRAAGICVCTVWSTVYYNRLQHFNLVPWSSYQECNDKSPLCQFVFIEIKALKPICRDLSNLFRLSALSSFSWFQNRVHSASHSLLCFALLFYISCWVCTVTQWCTELHSDDLHSYTERNKQQDFSKISC